MAYGQVWAVDVQDLQTLQLLEAVQIAIGPRSLYNFLDDDVTRHLQDEIVDRAGVEGDQKSGAWSDLAWSTNRIRDALGFPPAHPINERTGELLDFLLTSTDVQPTAYGAEMDLPGTPPDAVTAKKLKTAQQGEPQGENPLPGAGGTPPRPILAVDDSDMVEIMVALESHIIRSVIGSVTI